ncbi:hypothetical protein NKG94_27255 [Micromonospora sp. M12]
MLGEQPPLDRQGFTRFAESLGVPMISELVRDAVPLGSPARMRYPASVRRRYERLRRFPLGYLVVGDAVCSFNPLYGQGMTVAAAEGLLLRSILADGPDRLARRFFRGAGRLIDGPWSIAVGTDLRFHRCRATLAAGTAGQRVRAPTARGRADRRRARSCLPTRPQSRGPADPVAPPRSRTPGPGSTTPVTVLVRPGRGARVDGLTLTRAAPSRIVEQTRADAGV